VPLVIADRPSSQLLILAVICVSVTMKLYASGMNAWSQLSFDNEAMPSQLEDLYEFKVILEGEQIKPPASGLTYTKGSLYFLVTSRLDSDYDF
jgi:hypothetical protein